MADRYTVTHANQIKDASITEDELNVSVAGNGISGGAGSPLAVSPDTTSETTTEANAIIVGANGVGVKVDDSTLEGSGQGAVGAESIRVKALGIDTAELALNAVDGTIIEDDAVDSEHYVDGSIDNQHIADNTILEVKFNITNAPTDNYLLSYDSGSGGFTWVESPAASGVQEADLQKDDFTATLNGVLTDFVLSEIPVTNSLQVFISGKYGIEGSGKDYELNPDSGQTKTIRIAGDKLESTDRLVAHYIQDN